MSNNNTNELTNTLTNILTNILPNKVNTSNKILNKINLQEYENFIKYINNILGSYSMKLNIIFIKEPTLNFIFEIIKIGEPNNLIKMSSISGVFMYQKKNDIFLIEINSKTNPKFERNGLNLFLRAIIMKVFHILFFEKLKKKFYIFSIIANPISNKTLTKYFIINDTKSVKENNQNVHTVIFLDPSINQIPADKIIYKFLSTIQTKSNIIF